MILYVENPIKYTHTNARTNKKYNKVIGYKIKI